MAKIVAAVGGLMIVALVAVMVPLMAFAPDDPCELADAIAEQHQHGARAVTFDRQAAGGDLRQPTGTMSAEAIAQLAQRAGWRGRHITLATAVALAESSGNPSATNANTNGSTDYGLWQVNDVHRSSGFNPARGLEPLYNARQAHAVWERADGSWTPWVTFNEGLHLRFMPAARRAALNLRPVPQTAPASYGRPLETQPDAYAADLAALEQACAATQPTLVADDGRAPTRSGAGRPGAGSFPPANAAPWSALRDRALYGNGWGGASINMLDPQFARQLAEMEKAAGVKLQVTSGYRTAGYQAELCKRVAGPCAPPGRSLHQQGMAVDVANYTAYESYAERFRLCNNVPGDAVHYSAGWGARPCA